MTATDPLDLPEDGSMSLVYPFIVCKSQGGPYDDDAFTAGAQLGHVDQALVMAAVLGADRMQFTVRSVLFRQMELCGMARGFPIVIGETVGETEEYPAMPEWMVVTFATKELPS